MGRGMGMGRIFSPYHESWRKHPMLNPRYRDMFPGLSYAVVIFTTYCTLEAVYLKFNPPPAHGHGHDDHGHDDHH